MTNAFPLLVGISLVTAAAFAAGASAQAFPNKPIRVVVPFAPGGPNDVLGRIVALERSEIGLLKALGSTAAPDQALLNFDLFLANLPAGVQLFSLFKANPALLELLATIMGSAPGLAAHLARRTLLLDSVLSPDFYRPLPSAREMTAELASVLAHVDHEQDILDLARRWANDRRFQIGVQQLKHIVRPAEALTLLARFQPMSPGDVLLTGTPGGTALKAPPKIVEKAAALLPPHRKWEIFFKKQSQVPAYLQPGDERSAAQL